MSKVLLIKPRFLNFEFKAVTQPLGLMYIGAMLREYGHEPKIHDCALDHQDLHVLRRTIVNWEPDFIGLSIIVTELEQTKKIMEMIRELLPDVPVTFGGSWPTPNPEEALKEFGADYVVLGEGEFVFPDLIDAINKRLPTEEIPGTASIVNGELKINQGRFLTEAELNELPFPAWDLLDHKLYAKNLSGVAVGYRPYMSLFTSRGCPYRCAYCHQIMGKVFRRFSAESVLAEIEVLRAEYGFKEFEIFDDCFNVDRPRMRTILQGISERFSDVKLHFPAIRADILDPEDISLFKKAGTVSANFAIETTSPRLQKMIHKNLNIEKAARTIEASIKAGIYSMGYFMLGFPTETYEEASATVDFAVRSSLHRATFMLVTPYKGTELAKMIPELRGKDDVDFRYMNFYNCKLNISAMSDDELQTIFRKAYRRFYLNPKRLLRLVFHHPNTLSIPQYAIITLIKAMPLPRKYE
ncbi:MAG: B12-binding domain-containing radical SAM protein [Marinilabiliaceae bacterium]